MRSSIARAALIAGALLAACGGASNEDEVQTTTRTDSTAGAPADGVAPDSAASHTGHDMGGDSAGTSAGHDTHTAAPGTTGGSANAHAGHAAMPRGATASRAGHAETTSASGDAVHMPARPDNAHAGHVAAPADTTQAAHGAARADTAHAGHAAMRADTGHAAHAMARADTAHAGHAARPDSAHAAHPAPTADPAHAQHAAAVSPAHAGHGVGEAQTHNMSHPMWMRTLGNGWMVMGMAQAYPIVSTSLGAMEESSRDATAVYLTQPAAMFNVESPGSKVTLRTTLNFEGITQPNGELTFGGWGEGFLDKRHPHTLLHEFMLSANLWGFAGGDLSISAGKGFAPYGTDDPMSRPIVKYPTNHHLSQILERWTVNGAYVNRNWSLEAAVFGGGEPEGPYDFSNIKSFGDSWSARVGKRFGSGYGPMAETELSGSYGRVREVHHEEEVITNLYNGALRHERAYAFGTLYGLIEGSVSRPQEGGGYFSVLGETQLRLRGHQPYYRLEYATRPEYEREGAPGTQDFFRYDHDSHAIGATRWVINTVGYGYQLTGYPVSARPFIELQHSSVKAERGGIEPVDLFGKSSFWGLTAGFRIFLGGDPMRMGSYGVLDPMTSMHRAGSMPTASAGSSHGGHE